MNRFDIGNMFILADKNKDGLITTQEWEDFYLVFVVPFKYNQYI